MTMTTLDQAKEIVALFSQLDGVNKRLAEIATARRDGTSISIYFKNENRENNWGDVEGLKYETTFHRAGDLNDIAAIVLARMSDEVASRKRKIKRRLEELGAVTS